MFAVIDVETTGLNPYRSDRLVEVAVVVVDSTGQTIREFSSLINPERDVGPTRIHGLRARDLLNAPKFHEILSEILQVLEGTTAVVGHQIRFDMSFLIAEFSRLGLTFPESKRICTMELAGGGSLSRVCSQFGIEFCGHAHSALVDAKATAQLFAALMQDEPSLALEAASRAIDWPKTTYSSIAPLTREHLIRDELPELTYLQRLVPRMDQEPEPSLNHGAILAYSTLLAQVLEDRQLDNDEGQALVELATRWSIPRSEIQAVHRDFLRRIEIAALADGVVTEDERKDIHRVAMLLGIPESNLDEILNQASQHLQDVRARKPHPQALISTNLFGKTVCFTGEFQFSLDGQFITRDIATALAESNGLIPVRSVTKKLNLLVAADPLSLSGKANKARDYGIDIWSEKQFWQCLGILVR